MNDLACPKCQKSWGLFDFINNKPLVAKNYYIIGWIEDMRTKPSTCAHENRQYFCMDPKCSSRSWACIKCVGRLHSNCPEKSLKNQSEIKIFLQGEDPSFLQLISEQDLKKLMDFFVGVIKKELGKFRKSISEMTKGFRLHSLDTKILAKDASWCARHFEFYPSSSNTLCATPKFSPAVSGIFDDIKLEIIPGLQKGFSTFMKLLVELDTQWIKTRLQSNFPGLMADSQPQPDNNDLLEQLLKLISEKRDAGSVNTLIENGLKPLPTWGSKIANLIWRNSSPISERIENEIEEILSLFDSRFSSENFLAAVKKNFNKRKVEWRQLTPAFKNDRNTIVLRFKKWREKVLVIGLSEDF